ncbi:MAG: TonB-dependent receptor [Steroidobacteraceae bacterium]|nr:TonB-dependent receptor [Steroidobacteraceae bacterium]
MPTKLPLLNLTLTAALAAVVAKPVGAQDQRTSAGVEEVIVTAQKREESLQDTPISIVALSSKTLESRGIDSLTDLQADVPGLVLSPHPNSASTVRVYIRGTGAANDQITYDPRVALYVDGVYMARFQGLATEVAELERIEVLRGPQGALYGRNSTGGAINFITKTPQLGEFGFRQDLSAGNRNRLYARTRLNVPLGETAAAELSFLRASQDGFIRNAGSGVSRFGDQDRRAYRAAFFWRPNERFDLRYTFDRSDLDDTPIWLAVVPLYPAQASPPKASSPAVRNLVPNDVSGQGHNLTASFNVSDTLTLKSITGYRELDNFTYMPYHPGLYGPASIITNIVDFSQEQLSQELQLIGSALDSRLQYVGGLYYFDERATSDDVNSFELTGVRTDRHLTADNKAYAVFGQATYTPAALSGRLHLTLGARYSRDEREAAKQDVTTLANGATAPAPFGSADRTFSDFSPSAVVAFDVTDDLNVYAKAATGYQTGGFNLTASTLARFSEGFGAESVVSYELGLKSSWLENRLRVNAALFTTDKKDMQVSVMSDPNNISLTDILNAGKATVNGLELDVAVRPTPALNLSLSYAWLDAGYDEIVDVLGRDVKHLYGYDEAPKHKLSAAAEYTWPRTRLGIPSAMVAYGYQSKRVSSTSCIECIIGDQGLLDARLSIAEIPVSGGKLRFSLWGRNLTDEDYYTMHIRVVEPTAVFGEPRSYGADVSLEF